MYCDRASILQVLLSTALCSHITMETVSFDGRAKRDTLKQIFGGIVNIWWWGCLARTYLSANSVRVIYWKWLVTVFIKNNLSSHLLSPLKTNESIIHIQCQGTMSLNVCYPSHMSIIFELIVKLRWRKRL